MNSGPDRIPQLQNWKEQSIAIRRSRKSRNTLQDDQISYNIDTIVVAEDTFHPEISSLKVLKAGFRLVAKIRANFEILSTHQFPIGCPYLSAVRPPVGSIM